MPGQTSGPERLSDTLISLDARQSHHAKRVLRLGANDTVDLFDGRGTVGSGVIVTQADSLMVRLTQAWTIQPLTPAIDIAAATPKGPRAGEMVNQLSQLGADRYIPLQTHRGVVHPKAGRVEQLARIAIESAKQSQRAYLMTIDPPQSLAAVLDQPYDLRLIADGASSQATPQTHAQLIDRITLAKRVLILVGPEGGWTDEERQAAQQAGCIAWSLGPHVLRVETAATAAVAIARHMAAPLS